MTLGCRAGAAPLSLRVRSLGVAMENCCGLPLSDGASAAGGGDAGGGTAFRGGLRERAALLPPGGGGGGLEDEDAVMATSGSGGLRLRVSAS